MCISGRLFFASAAYCTIKFLGANETRYQIAYAAVFSYFVHGIGIMKAFAWNMVHEHSIKREILRLELRIAELGKAAKDT